ncbi:MAG: hypothetical protein KF803_02975 [Cyclobacteriaceae bacterium]|nr:hypothetical protein [Cyclobacteriaceae bacterium]
MRYTGIELVAETFDGDYWAIQCKCYQPLTGSSKKHVFIGLNLTEISPHTVKLIPSRTKDFF